MLSAKSCYISKKIAFLAFLAIFATNAFAECEAEDNWNEICPGTSFPDGVLWDTSPAGGNPGCYYLAGFDDWNTGAYKINGTTPSNLYIVESDVNPNPGKIDDGYYIYIATNQYWGNLNQSTGNPPLLGIPDCLAVPSLTGTASINAPNNPPRIGDNLTASLTSSNTNGILSYAWSADGTSVGSNSDSYTVTVNDLGKTIKVEISADDIQGLRESAPTAAVVKKPGPEAPLAPTEASKTHSSVTLTLVADNEYSSDEGTTWQDSPVFDGLSANTAYIFVKRIKETGDTYASEPSDTIHVTTDKNPAPDAPDAPEPEHRTSHSIELVAIENGEYSIDEGTTWQSSSIFTGLNPNTSYTFIQRINVDEDTEISGESQPTIIKTMKLPPAAPTEPPELADKTHNSVVLEATASIGDEEYEYSKDGGITWQSSPEFNGLSANTTYYFVQRITADEVEEIDASDASPALAVKTDMAPAPLAPDAPTVASKTHNSVTLVAIAGYEYSIDGSTWTTSPVFTGLDPDTEYNFCQRVAETDDTYASEASLALSVTTESQITPILASGGNLHVYAPKSVRVRIFDLKGKELLNRTIAPNEIVSIAHLPKGIYMVNIGKDTFKLVK